MKEFITDTIGSVTEKSKKAFRDKFAADIISAFSAENYEAVRDFATKHLERLGVVPEFVQENNPQFKNMRNKLNTEAGIIICNHPGWVETPAILSILHRDNLKIMQNKTYYDLLPPEVAIRYFFPAEHGPSLRSVLNKIKAHIEGGGILLIYPSGGNEKKKGTTFKSGLRGILALLKPDQMVYCFNINNEDAKEARPGVGLASELFLHPSFNINKTGSPQRVRMNEAYTKASEWQSSIEGVSKDDANQTLTKKYESMF